MKHTIRVASRRKVWEHADGSERTEIKVIVTYTDTEWRYVNPYPFEMEYLVSIWHISTKLWQWCIETPYEWRGKILYSRLLSGNNGCNGQKYAGYAATFKEATKSFRLMIVR